ncbi:MAG TPA: prolyl oligopeptidase family serine peptidase [Candidatus Acidoferrales bacterium]|nr:prolyl oligopeptidase family serine peptidase [Candidatus Acidoferrales bacterium]
MKPPYAPPEEVMEDLHGHKIADPFRWLENAESPQTRAFVEAQNAYTEAVLSAIPTLNRRTLRQRVEQLLTIGRVEPPQVGGNRFFYVRRDGRQNQPVLYVRQGVSGQDRVLLDVNALAPDGTVALDWFYPSPDGKFVAYGTSPNGSEISTLEIVEVIDAGATNDNSREKASPEHASVRMLPEKIWRTRAASVAWLPDSSGFYYTRYPRPGDVPPGEEVYHRHVFLHKIGEPGNADGLKDAEIFGQDMHPEHWPSVELSEDGHWLLVKVEQGWARTELFLKDLTKPQSEFIAVASGKDFLYNAEIFSGDLYITTNEDAPRFRVLKVSCSAPQRENWLEIIPQSEAVIEETQVIGRRLFLRCSRNAVSELRIQGVDGGLIANVKLPAPGTIFASLGGNWDSEQAFLGFTSFAIPPSVYQVTLDGKVTPWAQVESSIDPEQYQAEQIWFQSKDGTRAPMFVVSRKGLLRTGHTPTLLSGYGGFNVGRTPVFNRNAMFLLLERGGIYVDAQLRGGNEFGEEWHRDGMLEQKQNVFDDFIAAAEHLIHSGYTDPEHLAIQGGSNGGLLVGAVITQRPDLFRAAVCQVPLLDMLRYHQFQIARLWIPEYGSAENREQFSYLYRYSPYHHVREGVTYPATLFMTAESDTRVDPMHARKMAALMQSVAENHSGTDNRPILLRVDTRAGHGAGKPVAKLADDAVDFWTFLFWQLGLNAD